MMAGLQQKQSFRNEQELWKCPEISQRAGFKLFDNCKLLKTRLKTHNYMTPDTRTPLNPTLKIMIANRCGDKAVLQRFDS
jgi:hypothetical protein